MIPHLKIKSYSYLNDKTRADSFRFQARVVTFLLNFHQHIQSRLEDNISKIAIVLPKMQKELVKSYNHYAQENSFKWLGKIREVYDN